MDAKILKTLGALKSNHFEAKYYETPAEAVEYLLSVIDGEATIGIGGSITINSIGLIEKLKIRGNEVRFHWLETDKEKINRIRRHALEADVYLTSTNALTVDGKIVNVDGIGNRVAGMFYGPPKVYIVCGVNKITDCLDDAIKRIKSVAYKNCERMKLDVPCIKAKKCVDCKVPERACSVTTIIEWKPMHTEIEVIVINEDLGL